MNQAVLRYLLSYSLHGFILWSCIWVITKRYGPKDYFYLDQIDKVVVRVVAILVIGYMLHWIFEIFYAWYDGVSYESYVFTNRMFGPYWFAYWIMTFTSMLLPQIFWIEKVRASVSFRIIAALWMFCVLNFERFIIIMTSFHRDYLPSS